MPLPQDFFPFLTQKQHCDHADILGSLASISKILGTCISLHVRTRMLMSTF